MKNWKPKEGSSYWGLTIANNRAYVDKTWYVPNFYGDEKAIKEGRAFKTKKQALVVAKLIQPHLDAIKQILKENKDANS